MGVNDNAEPGGGETLPRDPRHHENGAVSRNSGKTVLEDDSLAGLIGLQF